MGASVADDVFQTEARGHGRHEKRSYTVLYDLQGIRDRALWAELTVIGMCYSERTVNGKTTGERRYFIGIRKAGARIYGKDLRNDRGIDNSRHRQVALPCGVSISSIPGGSGSS